MKRHANCCIFVPVCAHVGVCDGCVCVCVGGGGGGGGGGLFVTAVCV